MLCRFAKDTAGNKDFDEDEDEGDEDDIDDADLV
jgi:hypothetical protein